MFQLILLGVSLFFVFTLPIAMYFTNEHISYLKANPTTYPPYYTPSDYQPTGGFLGCEILNHTYFTRDNTALIDVFALIHANKSQTPCQNNRTIRFYGEFLQSCRCHNASQVNKTIDEDFPIGKVVSCCLSKDCLFFNNQCSDTWHSGSTDENPQLFTFQALYVLEWIALVLSIIIIVVNIGCMFCKKFRKRGYDALDAPKK